MTLKSIEYLVNQVLSSPQAPNVVKQIRKILKQEEEKRNEFYNFISEQMKAEFINGEIVIHSPVIIEHNEISGNLYKILDTYVVEKEAGFVGMEKILIKLTRNDYEPDVCYFKREKSDLFVAEQKIFPPPNLVIEVLSKSSIKRDRGIKFADYQTHAVQEYWIIDPKTQTVEQYQLDKNGNYELLLKSKTGILETPLFPNLLIPIKCLFDKKLSHNFIKEIYNL